MTREIITSMNKFTETYLPREYAKNLAKAGKVTELSKYLTRKKLDPYDLGLHIIMKEKDFSSLIGQITAIEIKGIFRTK